MMYSSSLRTIFAERENVISLKGPHAIATPFFDFNMIQQITVSWSFLVVAVVHGAVRLVQQR
jgi:hypothetical protein